MLILSALAESYNNPLFISGVFPVLKSVQEGEREDNPDVYKPERMSARPTLELLLSPEI